MSVSMLSKTYSWLASHNQVALRVVHWLHDHLVGVHLPSRTAHAALVRITLVSVHLCHFTMLNLLHLAIHKARAFLVRYCTKAKHPQRRHITVAQRHVITRRVCTVPSWTASALLCSTKRSQTTCARCRPGRRGYHCCTASCDHRTCVCCAIPDGEQHSCQAASHCNMLRVRSAVLDGIMAYQRHDI